MKITRETAMTWTVIVLRSVIGWHLLYEGMWKLSLGGGWTCRGLLRMSHWIAAPVLTAIAENPTLTAICDQMMVWGLVAIGLGLITGVLARYAALAGILLMTIFYVTMPPFMSSGGHSHFLFVDYGVLEACALAAIVVWPGPGFWDSLTVLVKRCKGRGKGSSPAKNAHSAEMRPRGCGEDSAGRRDFLTGLAGLPVLGAFGGLFAAKHGFKGVAQSVGLGSGEKVEAVTSASYRFQYQGIDDLTKKFDQFVKIGDFQMSRVTLGGNLIGGWAHSRDLQYVSTLMKAYNTERRIFDTMHLAEACGINTISTNPALMNFISKYWKEDGGTINFVSDCGHADENGELGVVIGAKKSVDAGAKLIYVHGFGADEWAVKNDWKTFEKALREMRKLGVPVGIGAHSFDTLKFCVAHDLIPDFWYKTFHPGGYWSAQKSPADSGEGEPGAEKKGWNDNNWCRDPVALAKWFESRPEPWVAFKTMAAGAVHPKQALPYVFNNGADAACMGMFDFQIVEDVSIANDYFCNGLPKRARKWN